MTDPRSSVPPGQPHFGNQQPSPEQWPPAESDRKVIADRLRIAVDEGRLDLMEYDRRLRAAESAGTMVELHSVVGDLPTPAEQVLTQIGEITITQTTVHTPNGPIPLRGAQWLGQDHWHHEQKMATWGIVLAVVLFFCIGPFSLLFLLAKESRYSGTVDVTVSSGSRQYTARIPIQSHQHAHHVHQQVTYARSLSSG